MAMDMIRKQMHIAFLINIKEGQMCHPLSVSYPLSVFVLSVLHTIRDLRHLQICDPLDF